MLLPRNTCIRTMLNNCELHCATLVLIIVFWGLLVCKGDRALSDGSGCGFPGEPLEGSVTPNKSNYETRDTVTYSCQSGYTIVGPRQITCRQDQTWSSDAPICLKEAAEFKRSLVADEDVNTCSDVTSNSALTLETIPFSLHSISAVIFSFSKVRGTPIVQVFVSNGGHDPQLCSTVVNVPWQDSNVFHKYDCDRSISGNTIQIVAKTTSAFSSAGSATICEIGITSETNGGVSRCGRPQIPLNGRLKHWTDDRVIYECDKAFYARSATSNCEDGVWKNLVQCKRKNLACGHPGCPVNGYHEQVDPLSGTVKYACLPGHYMVGTSVRSCLSNGTWSDWNRMPKCVPNVAYDTAIFHSDGSNGKNKPSVDGNIETCDVIGYSRTDSSQQRFWKLNFEKQTRISSIRIFQPKGQEKTLKVFTFYDSRSPRINIPCVQASDQAIRCDMRTPVNVSGIYIQPEDIRTNFTLCEVEVTDSTKPIPCGTIDEPLNSKVVYDGETPRIVCESGSVGPSDAAVCDNGQWRTRNPLICSSGVGTGTNRPNVDENRFTTRRPHVTKEPRRTTEHSEPEKDTVMVGVIGIAVGVTAASVSILISIVVIVCIMKRHYKKKNECNHNNCSRQNSHHNHSYGSGTGSGPRDWDESSIHLYETVKPEYETLEDPYEQTLVINESYVLATPKNTANRTRPRLAPPRNHIYDVVTTDDALVNNVLLNGHSNQRETIIGPALPRTSL